MASPSPLSGATRIEPGIGADQALEVWILRDRAAAAGRRLLDRLLCGRLGIAPSRLAYRREPCPVCGGRNGRPVLAGDPAPLHFSLARSEGVVLVGIAAVPVGVDVQWLPSREIAAEVTGLLHPDERREISSEPPERRPEALARLWVRKEAYLKGLGCGIAHGVGAEYVGAGRRSLQPPGWNLIDLQTGPGYAAAAAVKASFH